MRWQHFLAPHSFVVALWVADVTDRASLPQDRVETLIGSQAEFKITN